MWLKVSNFISTTYFSQPYKSLWSLFSIQWVHISTLPATRFMNPNCLTETKTFFLPSCVQPPTSTSTFLDSCLNAPAWRHSPWIHSLICLERIGSGCFPLRDAVFTGQLATFTAVRETDGCLGPKRRTELQPSAWNSRLKFLNHIIKLWNSNILVKCDNKERVMYNLYVTMQSQCTEQCVSSVHARWRELRRHICSSWKCFNFCEKFARKSKANRPVCWISTHCVNWSWPCLWHWLIRFNQTHTMTTFQWGRINMKWIIVYEITSHSLFHEWLMSSATLCF